MGLELIIDYCADSRTARQEEYDFCVRQNLAHPFVQRIHNLGISSVDIPEDIRTHSKWCTAHVDRRMTFSDAFTYANERLEGKMVGICNLDIFLDGASDWAGAEALLRGSNVVLCQSRTEFAPPASTYLDPAFARLAHANAQDAWFFIAPLNPPAIDFEIGTIGCDNALAERIRRTGAIPVNMASRYRVLHYDVCRGKHGANTNAVHQQESQARGTVYSRFPERDGCYLTPDIDMVPSIDRLLEQLGVDEIRRYQIVSDIVTERIKIRN